MRTFLPTSVFLFAGILTGSLFKAAKYDPTAWAHLFAESGAKYVVPVFEHHDGFTMYDSGLSDWTAMKMGPHRDLVGELAKAVRAEGMHLGASSHRVEHDWFLEGGVVKLQTSTTLSMQRSMDWHTTGAGGSFKISSVSLLGSDAVIAYEQKADGLHLKLPATAPALYAASFRIATEGAEPRVR